MGDKIKITVLGAGYGGILTAKKLARKFKKDDQVELTVIDKNSYHTMLTELHEVAAGRVPEDAIRIDLKKVFAGRSVQVVLDEITGVDFGKKMLEGMDGNYPYDYLVVGTGSKPTYFGCKGAKEHSFPLWSFEDAVRIKEQIRESFRKAKKERNPHVRARLLTFMVVGAGFTGIEMIGELAEWKDRLCRDYGIPKEEVTLYLVDMVSQLLPLFQEQTAEKAKARLEKMGVRVLLNSNITEVDSHAVCVEGKGCIEAETVIWTAGVESSSLLENVGLEKKGRGRIETNAHLQALGHENVYVVGDNIFFIPEGEDRPVPQMVENAEHSASTIAHNIAADVQGGEKQVYKPHFHGAMVCIGGKYGVAEVGMPGKFMPFSGFLAMFIKHFINVVYFLQVAGFNKVWTYLMHEIFHVPDGRSLFGGHFSKRSPNFWLLPLRLFVGAKWFLQGWEKLPKVLKDPGEIFLIPAKAADAVSAATAWEEEAGAAVEGASQWGEALPVPGFLGDMVEWSMDLFFYHPEGGFTTLASVFQAAMVVGEVIVGLLFLAGLFTALASIASILMGAMIWASGMAPAEMLWYLAAGVALIGGSGSVFGMDYYVLPFLKKHWKRLGFVNKWYLFTD
ncbi:NAD(P)/FAD-dependent oxidoreductase [Anaerotalea alkaliphila]|uniref:NADH:ubiquinone reductase (non-electrogenic) n=1 Tax=Anaerotalea alkaliphila TaxID=2662126 RepID=A0A7X5HTW4_9FIRM|nr:NAD(P)/FAD-dependent oxidoreductase [Anaerotalea alkaliphila]NDL66564.1 NAD(P)/FAD-dependent oxidoreductase [Anaerotalea alkaliphila]